MSFSFSRRLKAGLISIITEHWTLPIEALSPHNSLLICSLSMEIPAVIAELFFSKPSIILRLIRKFCHIFRIVPVRGY